MFRSALFALCAVSSLVAGSLTPARLRVEYLENPLGLDVRQPRLQWILESPAGVRSEKQTAYRVLVASSPEALKAGRGDLWDSGKVQSGESIHIAYAGKPLASRTRCYWKVRVWDRAGNPSPWSADALWTMGLLEKSDWSARWIGDSKPLVDRSLAKSKEPPQPAVLLRKDFRLDRAPKRATLYATARGLYEVSLNGRRVGDRLLAPEWTSYRKRIQYQAYDVTPLLRGGANAAGAMLGAGWYAGRIGLFPGRAIYGDTPQLLFQLEIESAGGRRQVIVSDPSWRISTDGPVRSSDILDGETYDARKQLSGWDLPGFDDARWSAATPASGLGNQALVWQPNEPIRALRELKPLAVREPRPGVYVFDMGQNMVGWVVLRVAGKASETVTLRYAEMLNDDGTIYTANLRSAAQVDRFIPRGQGEEVFEPRFTYHGFRYVEVTGLAAAPNTTAMVGRVIHSSSPDTGAFETSSEYLNKLMSNIVWTQRANLYSTPNDCPQRDERLGWMGDIQAFSQTAIFNMDMAGFFTKWLKDVRDDQAADGQFPDFAPNPHTVLGDNLNFGVPAWGDAGVIVPWRVYQNYADLRLLGEHFGAARRWVDFIERQNPDLLWRQARHNDYNDWLNSDTIILENWPKKGGAVPNEVFATAFFAHSTALVAKMAAVLGRKTDADHYESLAARVREAFNRAYVRPDGMILGDTQAGYAFALNFRLLPEAVEQAALERMVDRFGPYQGHLSTGIQSTHRLMAELARFHRHDEAYRLLNLRTFPSWGFMVENGATTIWERWDGYVKGRGFQNPGMNSFNHWAFGAVGEWMWREIAGIHPDDAAPGYAHFFVRPRPGGGLTWARGSYDSIRGRIQTEWRVAEGGLTLKVQVPANTTATVWVPAAEAGGVTESGKPANQAAGLRELGWRDGAAGFEVGSGEYVFRASWR